MTNAEKKMKKYVNAIERRLNLPLEVKARVMSDFASSIAARREAGQTDEQIMAELGSPKKVAAELNEQMKEFACKKNPWRFAYLALAVFGALRILQGTWMRLLIAFFKLRPSHSDAATIGIIGGADGPTAVVVTSPGWVHALLPVAIFTVGVVGYWKLKKQK